MKEEFRINLESRPAARPFTQVAMGAAMGAPIAAWPTAILSCPRPTFPPPKKTIEGCFLFWVKMLPGSPPGDPPEDPWGDPPELGRFKAFYL